MIKRREAVCREEATGGTIDLIDVPACLVDETIWRRLALEAEND